MDIEREEEGREEEKMKREEQKSPFFVPANLSLPSLQPYRRSPFSSYFRAPELLHPCFSLLVQYAI